MLTFTDAQVAAWLNHSCGRSSACWPCQQRARCCRRERAGAGVRVGLAFLITISAQASLSAMPVIPLDSPLLYAVVLSRC